MRHSRVRRGVARVIGERNFGVCQYLRDALRGRLSEERAFNGQRGRQGLFLDIVGAIRFYEIIETGTFRGDTTDFMERRSGLPVFSCESSPRHFGYSRARFAFRRKIHLTLSDSRAFLDERIHRHDDGGTAFAYLDAHWGPDLPLFEETRILFERPTSVVVMIDDFAVPDDPGYAFDSYGPAATLNFEYLRLADVPAVRLFFPAIRSSEETGARRGCIVLARAGPIADVLATLPSLRAWEAT